MKENQSKINRETERQKNLMLQWLFPAIVFFLVVLVMLYNYGMDVKDSTESRLSKQFSIAAGWYANEFEDTMEQIAQATNPFSELLSADGAINTKRNLTYISALKEKTQISEVWLVNRSGIGMDAEGYAVQTKDQALLLAITGNKAQYMMTTLWKNETPVIAYVCPLKSKDGCIVSFYVPTKFVADTSVFNFDTRSWYAVMDGDGEVISVTAEAETDIAPGVNIMDQLKIAQLDETSYTNIVNKMDKRSKFQFSGVVDGNESYFAFVPMEFNDWYYVICMPDSYVELLRKTAWQPTKKVLAYLGSALLVFLLVVCVINIISKKQFSSQSRDLEEKADTDLLTELNNKIATERKITEYMLKNPESQAMMFILDIDNFKKINDTMGHAFGDEVLRSIGTRLKSEFRVSDIIGRVGGDEFIILLKDIKTEELIGKEAERVASLFKHFKAGEYTKYSVTSSVGCAIYPRDGRDFESLYKAADQGLYRAKKAGKNQLAFYKDAEN